MLLFHNNHKTRFLFIDHRIIELVRDPQGSLVQPSPVSGNSIKPSSYIHFQWKKRTSEGEQCKHARKFQPSFPPTIPTITPSRSLIHPQNQSVGRNLPCGCKQFPVFTITPQWHHFPMQANTVYRKSGQAGLWCGASGKGAHEQHLGIFYAWRLSTFTE